MSVKIYEFAQKFRNLFPFSASFGIFWNSQSQLLLCPLGFFRIGSMFLVFDFLKFCFRGFFSAFWCWREQKSQIFFPQNSFLQRFGWSGRKILGKLELCRSKIPGREKSFLCPFVLLEKRGKFKECRGKYMRKYIGKMDGKIVDTHGKIMEK